MKSCPPWSGRTAKGSSKPLPSFGIIGVPWPKLLQQWFGIYGCSYVSYTLVSTPAGAAPPPPNGGWLRGVRPSQNGESHARSPRGSHTTVALEIEHAGQDERFPGSFCLSVPRGRVLG